MRKRRRGLALLVAAALVSLLPGCDAARNAPPPAPSPARSPAMSPGPSTSPPFRLETYEPPGVPVDRLMALVDAQRLQL